MRKFYKTAEAGPAPGGYVVRLDGKPAKTPLGIVLLTPSQALAVVIAAEWSAQEKVLRPDTMPLTKLANTMIDKSKGADRAAMNAELLKYGGSDLICYFADHPPELVKLHQQHWLPVVSWMKEKYGIALETVSGIQYRQQPQEALDMLKKVIESLDAAAFTVVQSAAAATGSVAIALAFFEEKLSSADAYEAACVDENYQLRMWGEDAAARERLETIHAELEQIARFRDLLKV